MSFFRNFPVVNYRFGDEVNTNLFQNLSAYIDMIDQISDDVAFYEKYTIMDGERPDVLSYKLYGTIDFYWSFFLLNEKLRVQGWPLTTQQMYSLSKLYYPNLTLKSNRSMSGEFFAGDIVTTKPYGNPEFKARIVEKNLDLGQIVVKPLLEARTVSITSGGSGYTVEPIVTITGGGGTGAQAQSFINASGEVSEIYINNGGEDYTSVPTITIAAPDIPRGETATATVNLSRNNLARNTTIYSQANQPDNRLWDDDITRALFVQTNIEQYNSIHHYEDAITGEWVDLEINTNGNGINNIPLAVNNLKPVSYLDRLIDQNTELAQIKVFKPNVITQVNNEFQKLLRRS